MKLIIEKTDNNGIYAYRESDARYQKMKKKRKGPQLDPAILDDECCLFKMPVGFFVFNVVEKVI